MATHAGSCTTPSTKDLDRYASRRLVYIVAPGCVPCRMHESRLGDGYQRHVCTSALHTYMDFVEDTVSTLFSPNGAGEAGSQPLVTMMFSARQPRR